VDFGLDLGQLGQLQDQQAVDLQQRERWAGPWGPWE
jgi:hypothetical protein